MSPHRRGPCSPRQGVGARDLPLRRHGDPDEVIAFGVLARARAEEAHADRTFKGHFASTLSLPCPIRSPL